MWIIWLVVALIFIAAEVITQGFFLLWFGVGALVATLAALLGIGSLTAQVALFLLVSLALLIASRTIFERFLPGRPTGQSRLGGAESMIGKTGVVIEASEGPLSAGAVSLYGSIWTAYPVEGDRPLVVGEKVEIERIEGNSLHVRHIANPQPLFGQQAPSTTD